MINTFRNYLMYYIFSLHKGNMQHITNSQLENE